MTDRAGSILELLTDWLPRQRWYAGKGGGDPELVRLGGLQLSDVGGAPGSADVDVWFVQATTPDGVGVAYQVPLTLRTQPAPELEHAFVGSCDAEDGERYVYDGPHDPAYLRALLRLLAEEGEAWAGEGAAFGRARRCRRDGAPRARSRSRATAWSAVPLPRGECGRRIRWVPAKTRVRTVYVRSSRRRSAYP